MYIVYVCDKKEDSDTEIVKFNVSDDLCGLLPNRDWAGLLSREEYKLKGIVE